MENVCDMLVEDFTQTTTYWIMEYVFWYIRTNVHLKYWYHILLNVLNEFNQLVVNIDLDIWKYSYMLREPVSLVHLWPLLLTWINFNPSMDN